jgi:hypothetical protein
MIKKLMTGRGLALIAAVLSSSAATVVAATPAGAAGCTVTHYGPDNVTNASFKQQATMDFCSGGVVRVGVRVTPQAGYDWSHIINCTAHLQITDTSNPAPTKSDRPVNCTSGARSGVFYTAGPSSWTGQSCGTHTYVGEAWVNIQTGVGEYQTYSYRSPAHLDTIGGC